CAADDRADRVEHRGQGVIGGTADFGDDRRHDDRDDQHLGRVHRNPADYERRVEAEPVTKDLAPTALFDLVLSRLDPDITHRAFGASSCSGMRSDRAVRSSTATRSKARTSLREKA